MNVLEGLIAILPIIVLVVVPALLAIRRLLRRRRAENSGAAGTAGSARPRRDARRGLTRHPESSAPPWTRPEFAGASPSAARPSPAMPRPYARPEAAPAAGTPPPAMVAAESRREGYVYPPPLHLRRLSGAPGAPRLEPPTQAAATIAVSLQSMGPWRSARPGTGVRADRAGGPPVWPSRRGTWRRVEGLPTLKRAIVLMEILGPPRGIAPAEPGWPAGRGR